MTLQASLMRLVENLLIAGFVGMIAMVFGNVVLRYGFDSGIIVSEEVSRMIFVWLTFGGAFLVAKDGGHLGMTALVTAMGRRGRWVCRLLVELLSLGCMGLMVSGAWAQTVLNVHNPAPISGIPLAVTYLAAVACGIGIAILNVINLVALFQNRMSDDELVIGSASEEEMAHEPSKPGQRQ
jgi:TRAP-type C4-dicarboxylate transport system permease small subunit